MSLINGTSEADQLNGFDGVSNVINGLDGNDTTDFQINNFQTKLLRQQ
ncbi:hypothetical protein CCP3SC15_20022 [Gammaproteobacteria bacterium]